MKYNRLLLLGFLFAGASTTYAIPKPPEMHPRAEVTELLNPRIEIISRDDQALEVVLRGEVRIGDNDCLAENNKGILSQKRSEYDDPELKFEAYVITSFVGKGKCDTGRLNPIFKTVEKTIWVEEVTDKLTIFNPNNADKPTEFFMRGETSEVRAIDILFVKKLSSGKSIYNVSGEIYVGSNSCLALGVSPFFSVTRSLHNELRLSPQIHITSVPQDKECTLQYSPQWSFTSSDVEVDSLLDIVILNRSFEDYLFDEI